MTIGRFTGSLVLVCGLFMTSACAPKIETGINDPFESRNREAHQINKDINNLIPDGGGERSEVVETVAVPVHNFADTVSLPGMVLNGLLQGDIGGASTNTFRFVLNSTVGLFGLVDVAGAIGLHTEDTDFGETLYVWGVPEGAYLEIVGLGPTTERDLVGRVVDMALNPLKHVGSEPQLRYGTAAKIGDKVLSRQQFSGTVDDVLNGSADSYAQTRLMYLQHRRYELGQGGAELDPYEALE